MTLFIGTIPKIAYLFLFINIFTLSSESILTSYCFLICLLSIIYGTIVSLYQVSLRRLLGYGSMVHMGFIIYSAALYTPESITASIFYLLVYIILMMFVFSFMFVLFEKQENNNISIVDEISKLNVILNKNYILSLCIAFILLSLAGLPFFVGFISK